MKFAELSFPSCSKVSSLNCTWRAVSFWSIARLAAVPYAGQGGSARNQPSACQTIERAIHPAIDAHADACEFDTAIEYHPAARIHFLPAAD